MTASRHAASLASPRTVVRRRRQGPNWAAIGLGLLVIVALVGLAVAAWTGRGATAEEAFVLDQVNPIADRSDQVAEDFTAFLADPAREYPNGLNDEIGDWASQARSIADEAKAIEPPDGLSDASGQFKAAMAARATALEMYAETIAAAGEERRMTDVLVSALTDANRDILASDRVYGLFVDDVEQALLDAGVANVEVRRSQYFVAPEVADEAATKRFAAILTGEEVIAGLRDVEILSVAFDPQPVSIDDDVLNIVADGSLTVIVTLRNNGDRTEKSLAVDVAIRTRDGRYIETDRSLVEINDIEPGKSQEVEVRGLRPEPGRSRILVQIGPVPNEEADEDNYQKIEIDYTSTERSDIPRSTSTTTSSLR